MPTIGAWELGLIAIVALLVLGPERLPVAARTVGAYLRRARESWFRLKSEVERELAAEDLKKRLADQVQPPAEASRPDSGHEPPRS